MIKVQDWIASIPEEEKHIAYVGEGQTEQREFLLCGKEWEKYRDYGFHLDMAFDPVSITTRDCRQVVQTTVNSAEHKEEAGVTKDEVTTKETYTVCDEEVLSYDLTDVAPLDKWVEQEGIRLTWTVLRQHTQLPGKLKATIRAVGEDPNCIKKSAMMVFEVEPSVAATPAAVPPVSEFQQMESEMDALRQGTVEAAQEGMQHAMTAASAAQGAADACTQAVGAAQAAQMSADGAASAQQGAVQAQQDAAEHARRAEQYRGDASAQANAAVDACAEAKRQAAAAESARISAAGAANKCSEYVLRAEGAADTAVKTAAEMIELAEHFGQAKIEDTDVEKTCLRFANQLYDTDKAESFIYFTDPHVCNPPDADAEERMLATLGKLKHYYDATPTSFVVCGGDWLNDVGNGQTNADACYKLGRAAAWMRANFDRFYTAIGNHEDNYPYGVDDAGQAGVTNGLSMATIRNLMLPFEKELYYAFEGAQTTFYVMNSSDVEDDRRMTDYRWEQVDWLAKRLKEDDADHAAIVIHAALLRPIGGGVLAHLAENLLKLCQAYNAGTTIELNGVSYDFSACMGCVHFMLAGHIHDADCVETHYDIPVVLTRNMLASADAGNGYHPTFDLCLADYEKGVLQMMRVGPYGTDREVLLAQRTPIVLYTNLADPTSADWVNDGALYGNGELRSGEGLNDGLGTVSNYIAVKEGDVLRFKGFDRDTITNGNQPTLLWYDENKVRVTNQFINTIRIGASSGLPASAVMDENGVLTHTVIIRGDTDQQFVYDNISSRVRYVRISALRTVAIEEIVITVNEPIVS